VRDLLAADRTALANERTLLAYIRTAIATLATGIGLPYLFKSQVAVAVGVVLIAVSLFVAYWGVHRFRAESHRLRQFR
jgi:putative membrane protein